MTLTALTGPQRYFYMSRAHYVRAMERNTRTMELVSQTGVRGDVNDAQIEQSIKAQKMTFYENRAALPKSHHTNYRSTKTMRKQNKITKIAVSALFMSALAIPAMAMATGFESGQGAGQSSSMASSNSTQPVSDTWITTKVKSELLANSQTKGMDISVHTMNGVVTLSGSVDSKAEKTKATQLAKSVKGVTQVNNDALMTGQSQY